MSTKTFRNFACFIILSASLFIGSISINIQHTFLLGITVCHAASEALPLGKDIVQVAIRDYLKELLRLEKTGVKLPIQARDVRIQTLGSWTAEGGKYRNPLDTRWSAAGIDPSDCDMRIIVPNATSEAVAKAQWTHAQDFITKRITELSGNADAAKAILANTNIYPPKQLIKNVTSADSFVKKLSNTPNLGGSPPEGTWGPGSESWQQVYESKTGQTLVLEGDEVVVRNPNLAILHEGKIPQTIDGAAAMSQNFSKKALETLEAADGEKDLLKLSKNFERMEEARTTSRTLARLSPDNKELLEATASLRNNATKIESLRQQMIAAVDANDAIKSDEIVKEISQITKDFFANSEEVKKLYKALNLAKFELDVLFKYPKGGPNALLGYQLIDTSNMHWGRYKIQINEYITSIGWEDIDPGRIISIVGVAIDAYMTVAALEDGDSEAALRNAFASVTSAMSAPAAILGLFTNAIIEDAKESGYIFAGVRQDCQDLLVGICNMEGRAQVLEKRIYTTSFEDLISKNRMATDAEFRAVFGNKLIYNARHCASRGFVGPLTIATDEKVGNAAYDHCMITLNQKWREKRRIKLSEAALLESALVSKLQSADLSISASPDPVSLSPGTASGSFAPATVELTANVRDNLDRIQIEKLSAEFEKILRELGTTKNYVYTKVEATVVWSLDGKVVRTTTDYLDHFLHDNSAHIVMTVADPGSHVAKMAVNISVAVKSFIEQKMIDRDLSILGRVSNLTKKMNFSSLEPPKFETDDVTEAEKLYHYNTSFSREFEVEFDVRPGNEDCKYTYAAWGECNQATKTQMRQILSKSPEGCIESTIESLKPIILQPCQPVAPAVPVVSPGDTSSAQGLPPAQTGSDNVAGPSSPIGKADDWVSSCTFEYSDWGECDRTKKTRSRSVVSKSPAKCEERQKPVLEQSCTPPPTEEEKQNSYYNCLCRCSGGWDGSIGVAYDPEGKMIPGCESSGPCIGGMGAFGCTRRHFFGGADECAKSCWEGIYGQGTYDKSKADKDKKTENKKFKKPILIKIKASKNPADFGDIVDLTAETSEGSGGYQWKWSGCAEDAKDANAKVLNSRDCKPCQASVTVMDQDGDSASDSLTIQCTSLRVKLTKESPAENTIPVGGTAKLFAEVFSGDKPAEGSFTYHWEPNPDVLYGDPKNPEYEKSGGSQSRNTALFQKLGLTKVWVSVLKDVGGKKMTMGESEQIVIDVVSPSLTLTADKMTPTLGELVTLKVVEEPKMGDELLSFWWEISGETLHAGPVANIPNSRSYSYNPKNDKPVTVTVHAKSKENGDELDKKSLTITAQKLSVDVAGPKIAGPPPMVWKQGVGLVPVDRGIAEGQRVEFSASVTPTPVTDLRYHWVSSPEGCSMSASSSKETGITCNTIGTYTVTVAVRNSEDVELGIGAGTFAVNISQSDLTAGKNSAAAQALLEQAKKIIPEGKLDEAIALASEAVKLDRKNEEAVRLGVKWLKDRQTIKQHIQKIDEFLNANKTDLAEKDLEAAKKINAKYPPIIEAESRVKKQKDDLSKVSVKIRPPIIQGPQRQIWKCDSSGGNCALASLSPDQFLTKQDLYLQADVIPAVPGVTYSWSVTPSGVCGTPGKGPKLLLNCTKIGDYAVHLGIQSAEGSKIGNPADLIVHVTTNMEDATRAEAAAQAAKKMDQAKKAIEIGQLDLAVKLAGEALKLDRQNQEANTLGLKWLKEQKEITSQLKIASAAITQKDPTKAEAAIAASEKLHPKYGPVKDARSALTELTATIATEKAAKEQSEKERLAKEAAEKRAKEIADANAAAEAKAKAEAEAKAFADAKIQAAATAKVAADKKAAEDRAAAAAASTGLKPNNLLSIEGTWDQRTSTWTITKLPDGSYHAQEAGLGNASGPGHWTPSGSFKIDYITADGTVTGYYDVRFASDGKTATGDVRELNGPKRTATTSWIKVSGPPVPSAGANLSSENSPTTSPSSTFGNEKGTWKITMSDNCSQNVQAEIPGTRKDDPYVAGERTITSAFDNRVMGGDQNLACGPVVIHSKTFVAEANSQDVRTSASSSATTSGGTQSQPPPVTFESGNTGGTSNGPTVPTTFTFNEPQVLASIQTYHWNDGQGAPPGSIAVQDSSGKMYGPWQVLGTPGQGGVQNAYWTSKPKVILPSGTYTVIDSDTATWSTNSESGNRGFVTIESYPASQQTDQSQGSPSTGNSGSSASIGKDFQNGQTKDLGNGPGTAPPTPGQTVPVPNSGSWQLLETRPLKFVLRPDATGGSEVSDGSISGTQTQTGDEGPATWAGECTWSLQSSGGLNRLVPGDVIKVSMTVIDRSVPEKVSGWSHGYTGVGGSIRFDMPYLGLGVSHRAASDLVNLNAGWQKSATQESTWTVPKGPGDSEWGGKAALDANCSFGRFERVYEWKAEP